jgi:small nuclear ribonucleoprotein (snRNP)-like protein
MSIFTELRNQALVRELDRELNTDVVLFGFDGFAYFGNLQAVEDCRIAILSPAIEAKCNAVEILTPGGEILHVDFTRVDLWNIVAKGTAIVRDPFENLEDSLESARTDFEEATERTESRHLVRVLCRMVGDSVVLTTLGGFSIEGTLIAIDDCLAILSNTDIFVPGSSSPISDRRIRSAVVNLEALTSVSGVCCC